MHFRCFLFFFHLSLSLSLSLSPPPPPPPAPSLYVCPEKGSIYRSCPLRLRLCPGPRIQPGFSTLAFNDLPQLVPAGQECWFIPCFPRRQPRTDLSLCLIAASNRLRPRTDMFARSEPPSHLRVVDLRQRPPVCVVGQWQLSRPLKISS